MKATHRGFRGPNNFLWVCVEFTTIFCLRALCILEEIERRFFDAESTDADASMDRGARKRSKTVGKIIAFAMCLGNEMDASRFSGPEQFFAGFLNARFL